MRVLIPDASARIGSVFYNNGPVRNIKAISIVGSLLSATLFPGCANALETNYLKPLEFNPEPYCESVDRQTSKDIPINVQNIIQNGGKEASSFKLGEAMLVKAAIDVAHASKNFEACQGIFSRGAKQFYPFLRSKQNAFQKLGNSRLRRNKDIRKIQQNIIRLWREDQSARGVYVALQTSDETGYQYWASRLASAHTAQIDGISQKYIESVMEQFGWIDSKRFGKTVSNHAWLLVQHADHNPEFQAMALKLMEPYLESGGINRSNYAYLFDRVAVNTGMKQRFGTQPDWICVDGEMQLQPLEDPKNVNKRRKKMGMESVEDGLSYMNSITCVGRALSR